MGLRDIKKEIRNFEKTKLIEIIAELYQKNKSVREYFEFYINPNETELFQKFRQKVFVAFYPAKAKRYCLKDG